MPGFSFPTSRMNEWYNHPAFNRYWTHYSMVQDWLNHCRRSQEMANFRALQDTNYHHYVRPAIQPPNAFVGGLNQYCSYNQPFVPSPQEVSGGFVYGDHVVETQDTEYNMIENDEDAESEGSEFEMVISEEWISLIKQSESFRREREALKQAEERLREKVEFVELGSFQKSNQKNVGQCTKEDKKVKEEEMKRLYGSRSSHIRSMEIAMQLTFDRYYDLKKPALWPVIPLKL